MDAPLLFCSCQCLKPKPFVLLRFRLRFDRRHRLSPMHTIIIHPINRALNPQLRVRAEGITDPFGPPAVEEAFDAIVVSSETVTGAEKINELRAQKGFRPLAVAVTRRMAVATLSSSYLRQQQQQQQKKK